MQVNQAFQKFFKSHRQTKWFILTTLIYLVAIIWTTVQAYVRLEYNRSHISRPIIIHDQDSEEP